MVPKRLAARLDLWLRKKVCGRNGHIPLFAVWGKVYGQPSVFVECARCSLVYFDPWEYRPRIPGLLTINRKGKARLEGKRQTKTKKSAKK